MIEKILPDFYRIEVPLPGNPLKALNSYLIQGNGRNLLIDTGFNQKECRTALTDGLNALNVSLEETDIFVTHSHADHSGLVTALATNNSVVYCSETDAKIINLTLTATYWSELQTLFKAHGFPSQESSEAVWRHPGYSYNPDREQKFTIVKENDSIKIGDYHFLCIETPGHTPGHMCLYEPIKKILVSGDHILASITPNISIEKWLPNPLDYYLNSLEKINQLEIRLVLPGHRQLIDNARERIGELKQHHVNRLNETLHILTAAPMNAYQVASKMIWNLTYAAWDQFPITQRLFATGEAMSHLVYLWEKGTVSRVNKDGKLLFARIT